MYPTPNLSFELFPPKSPRGEESFAACVSKLRDLQPDFFSVTYGAAGSDQTRGEELVSELSSAQNLPVAAHITAVGASKAKINNLARRWATSGVRRLVALRGDMPELGAAYQPHPEGYANAADLVSGLRAIADFDISVAAYPESHPDSPDQAADLDNLKRKLDAGASRAITQYFFDADQFLRFRDRAKAAGITQPLIPGILPIHSFAQTLSFSQRCGASVPDWLKARFEGLDEDPELRSLVAASTAAELCRQLQAEGVQDFHFYTLNRPSLTLAVCRILGLTPALQEAA
ncbi:methylenetetrahydrofolate reductase [NAD(P)H] [Rhodovibrionaceae bacterium A322]